MFNIFSVAWADGGPFIDVLSLEDKDGVFHSVFSFNMSLVPLCFYLEIFGLVFLDTYPDEEE